MLAGWFTTACSVTAENKSTRGVLTKAEQEIKAKLANCNGSWYTELPDYGILEMKDISFRVVKESLTPADKANNIDWKGLIIVEAKLWRSHFAWQGWGQWADGQLMYGSPGERGAPLTDPRKVSIDHIHGVPLWGGLFRKPPVFSVSMVNGNLRWQNDFLAYIKKMECASIPK